MKSKFIFYQGFLILFIVFSTLVTAQDCYETSIVSPSPFIGNNGEIFELEDGSLWEVKHEYGYWYEFYLYKLPVIICPSLKRLIIEKEWIDVELIATAPDSKMAISRLIEEWKIYEETNLEGGISGEVQQGHIFKTTSGNIYEVIELTLQLVLSFEPKVIVLRNVNNVNSYKLIIEGFNEPLRCICINCLSVKKNCDE